MKTYKNTYSRLDKKNMLGFYHNFKTLKQKERLSCADLHVAGLKDCDQLMSDLSPSALFIPFGPASEAPAPQGVLVRIVKCSANKRGRFRHV